MAGTLHIVIIDDHAGNLELLSTALKRSDVTIHTASTPAKGLDLVRELHPRLVLTDLMMPEMNGLEVLQQIMKFDPSIDVLLMTGHYTTETAVEAIRKGAADYLQKPVSIAELRERVGELISRAQRRIGSVSGDASVGDAAFEGMIARSDVMWDLFARIDRIAPHFRSVLVLGPTGAGKDLVAKALHHRSRSRGKFVVLNCSAVMETLFESEMFGHVRGAFSGAVRDREGMLRRANQGTAFLDEVGDLPVALQAKLLRVLQERTVDRIGGRTPIPLECRK